MEQNRVYDYFTRLLNGEREISPSTLYAAYFVVLFIVRWLLAVFFTLLVRSVR